MTNYRRNRLAGGTFFFTVNLADRSSSLLTAHIDLLRDAFRYAKQRHPFTVEAVVVLPDHLHAVWSLPPDDADYALRWRLIKTHFSRSLAAGEKRSTSRQSKYERGIWQRRYWEHTIRDETDLVRTLITFTSIRSSTAMRRVSRIGRTHRFIASFATAYCRWIGPAMMGREAESLGSGRFERRWVSLRSTHPTALSEVLLRILSDAMNELLLKVSILQHVGRNSAA